MKLRQATPFAVAVLFHAGVLCFGGLIFFHGSGDKGKTLEEVALFEDTTSEPDKPPEVKEEIKADAEPLPEMAAETPAAPEPLSLSELEVALNPVAADGGGSAFATTYRLGGVQGATTAAENFDAIFSMADLDQKPRPLIQIPPQYPAALRQKQLAGTVVLLFVVDKQGRVESVQVEHSSDPAFEKPALEAVRQWKFEPGTRGGQKVNFKMRLPIRFSPA